ncbi:SNF1 protein kinase subunit beta-3 [[Candida] jaroonii]|uniref:SNF1 protein kinase subunit beta-3 n=1 Tax=[Candida] jaroonii TaxID=467808 RepID=A0ACA9Y859_9ASCO|nr:SNF1 protein kinase subunit beta-3 [[Candida] jaroonii]
MSTEPRDISMIDVSNALTEVDKPEEPIAPPTRRKSTLILTDEDMKIDQNQNQTSQHPQTQQDSQTQSSHDDMHIDRSQTNLSNTSNTNSTSNSENEQSQPPSQPDLNVTVPVEIRWTQGGEKVYVTGSFTGWRKMIGLARQPDNTFLITLGLPIGTHRFRFVIDNELRFSDYLPTATDQMGNFVNYVEVTPENVEIYLQQQEQEKAKEEDQQQPQEQPTSPSQTPATTEDRRSSYDNEISRRSSVRGRTDSMWRLTNDDDDMGDGYSRYHDEDENSEPTKKYDYITDIPPIFIDPKVMEQYYIAIEKQSKSQNGQQAWLHPPQLPPHLENVILNNFNSMDRDNNSGALPIPNHVVLNHLATTSIKHNTLSVASVVRYKRKYVTQVLYAPLQQ